VGSPKNYEKLMYVLHCRQPAYHLAWQLQAPAVTAGGATKCISLKVASKMAAINVNTAPKTANI